MVASGGCYSNVLRDAGPPEPTPPWTQRVYYALLHEAASGDETDADAMATRVMDTLITGSAVPVGSRVPRVIVG